MFSPPTLLAISMIYYYYTSSVLHDISQALPSCWKRVYFL